MSLAGAGVSSESADLRTGSGVGAKGSQEMAQ